jgi:hypothetical protein
MHVQTHTQELVSGYAAEKNDTLAWRLLKSKRIQIQSELCRLDLSRQLFGNCDHLWCLKIASFWT